ncbi:unnamed protein product [Oppiella nova]|uniref:Cytochrome P450 n=1 Tax=Oppiella nova TaxID=334625 RepID=A0A7R9QHB1_9ACAR|nr:unnamed protein product [Oppiella nova]CAG2165938.1 unnamed protein product [Oppiella nova]
MVSAQVLALVLAVLALPVLIVAEPELIKHIIVTDFHVFHDRLWKPSDRSRVEALSVAGAQGDRWRRVRAVVSPVFRSRKLSKMHALIDKLSNRMVNALDVMAKNEGQFDAVDTSERYVTEVIVACGFGTKSSALTDLDDPYLVNARTIFSASMFRFLCAQLIPTFLRHFLNIKSLTTAKEIDYFKNLLQHILTLRLNSGQKYTDFMGLLINARKEWDVTLTDNDSQTHYFISGDEEPSLSRQSSTEAKAGNPWLSDEEIVAQGVMLVGAGFGTTASTLAFMAYELALNPSVQQKLYDEINGAIDSDGEIPYDVLTRLPYLDAVLSETLRLHTPVPQLVRVAARDYKLGDTGITIPKGMTVEVPIYAIHRSPKYYPNPDQFEPDRFLQENKFNLIPYTYLPFGGGPRLCVGMRFAFLMIKVAMVMIIRKYRLSRTGNTESPLMGDQKFLSTKEDICQNCNVMGRT